MIEGASNPAYRKETSYLNGSVYRKVMSYLHKPMQLLTVLLAVSFLTFVLTSLAPGEPGAKMYEAAGVIPTQEMLALTRSQLGLDKPFLERYFLWLIRCLQGDLGTSFSQHDDVLKLILKNLQPTITLALCVLFVTLTVSLPLGILSAVRKNKFTDYIIRFTSFVGNSAPNFLIALILTYVFSYQLKLIPVFTKSGTIQSLILPVLSLAVVISSEYTRQIRAFFLEELSQDYVYGARARGVSESRILFIHVMRNTMLPLVTLIAFSLGSLLGGVAIIEVIFSFQGLGNLIIYAVDYRDYPLIQGLVLWIAMCYTLINIFTDLLYQALDPRLRKVS
ncbi:ABC transporter permease [Vibrio sp. WXL103]|uniref:ABC transporter permease n=1 Tax=unclassified Vibrio TaxID=2614977 RepID=UPI003EC91B80